VFGITLLSILSIAVHLYLAVLALTLDRRSAVNRVFAGLCLVFAVWSLGQTHVITAPTREVAWFWYRVSSVGWCLGPALLLHFFVLISERDGLLRRRWQLALLYLPAAIFQVKYLTGQVTAGDFVLTDFGWDEVVYGSIPWAVAYMIYYLGYAIFGLGMVYLWGKRSQDQLKRSQARMILVSGAPVLLAGTVSNVVLRHLEIHVMPGLAHIFMAAWGVGIWTAIRRYRLMTISASVAGEDIVRTMADALLLTSMEGEILVANPAAAGLFDQEQEALVGQKVATLFPDTPLFAGHQLAMSLQAEPIQAMEILVGGGVETGRTLSISASLVRDANDRPAGVAILMRDISEQVRMHRQLARAEQAAQTGRLASVGMLAAGVAHEINNPLTYVLGNLQVTSELLEELDGGEADEELVEEMKECMLEADEGARRVATIVTDLKSFARVGDEKTEQVEVEELLDRSLQMTLNQIKYRAQVEKEYSETPLVAVNEGQLCQVFVNLLVNAAQAIPEGAVQDNKITLRTAMADGRVQVEVEDTGSGIPDELKDRLFDPFFTTKEPGVGPGLGLSISQNIVGKFGGRIEVRDGAQGGTVFSIWLPAANANEGPSTGEFKLEPTPVRAGGRILVVDDEPVIGRLVRRILGKRHEVVVAHSGQEAMDLLKQDQGFDLILTDLMMPAVSGMDLFSWMEQNEPELAARALFITGGAFTAQSREFIDKHHPRVLFKPLDARMLSDAVRSALC